MGLLHDRKSLNKNNAALFNKPVRFEGIKSLKLLTRFSLGLDQA